MNTPVISWQWPAAIILTIMVFTAVVIAAGLWARSRYPRRPVTGPGTAGGDAAGEGDASGTAPDNADDKADGDTDTPNARPASARIGKRQKKPSAYSWTVSDDLQSDIPSQRYKLYRRLSFAAAIALAAISLITALLMGRPSTVDRRNSTYGSRDIVLCLDVSGSALAYDRQIIAAYLTLIDRLQGDRIGLSIFDSTTRTVFPLTDDSDVIESQLKHAFGILKKVSSGDFNNISQKEYAQIQDWLEGTRNITNSSSLIGDGLVSCALQLPQFSVNANGSADKKGSSQRARSARSASIILATDNIEGKSGTYSLEQAAGLVNKSRITVDGLYVGPASNTHSPNESQMRTLIERYGGSFTNMNTTPDIGSLVQAIERTSSGTRRNSSQSIVADAPQALIVVLVLAFGGYLALTWRLRR